MLRLVPEQVFSNVIFTFYNATTHPKTCGRYGELRAQPRDLRCVPPSANSPLPPTRSLMTSWSFPNEQDAAFRAFEEFHPLGKEQLKEIEDRAAQAIEGKGRCWWNPEKGEGKKRHRFGIQIVE